jgi:cytochrome c-type biogenesis protein CcmH/NrfG
MEQTKQKSFLIILGLVFLLPIFFIPGGALTLAASKLAVLMVGLIASLLFFLHETWKRNDVSIPWHPVIIAVILLPIVYLLSAVLSTPSNLSLFGYSFETGTFGFMLVGSVLLMLSALLFTDNSRVLQGLTVFFASFSLVILFAIIKIFAKGAPVLGVFPGITDGPLGRWTDLATGAGLLLVFSILMLGMIPLKKSLKLMAYSAIVLSLVLLVVLNFSTAFIFTLVISVVLFLYFKKYENKMASNDPAMFSIPVSQTPKALRPTTLLIIVSIISLIFIINPTISETRGRLGDVISNSLGIENIEVRPSFTTTLSISRAALSSDVLLGSGPNTFSRDWLSYKPVEVNTTPFWATAFAFGIGFIPTQIASTGIVGTITWLVFLILLLILAVKVLFKLPESKSTRFSFIASFVVLSYLWLAAFFYVPSSTLLMLAFIFSGIFIAVCKQGGIIGSRTFGLSTGMVSKSISTILILAVAVGSLTLGYLAYNKTLSSLYFKKAVDLSNIENTSLDEIEAILNKALEYDLADTHYVAISRVNFARAQIAANDTEGKPEDNLVIFQNSISRSVAAAREATNVNPTGYQNWIALGAIYSYLVPPPLSVSGAYDNAVTAFVEAGKQNPLSPEIPLFQARLEINQNEIEAARALIRQAITLKADYAEAYLMLAQLAIQQNDIAEAISSAEKLSVLVAGNPAIHFELGLLKYSSGDFEGAAKAFSSALSLVPDYANAQYYLGLSLSQLKRLDEALRQFEALAVTNPDSQEVKLIIEELKVGKTTFLNNRTR